ncbi:unnamed protein product [Symbiodinium sp. CCMP2456]|nr:unnamed protein product [Symbiodinium sp. CCMP2456]
MSKLEKDKVRRICSPKKGSGRLEVPENVFEMWQDAAKGRDSLFRMWCKSGGVKAVFMESLTIMTRSSRSKKLEVKGGFYSREDMKTELGYSQSRIEKIVAWAEKKGLVRTCEYDDETLEYWVNTRTTGTLTKEDLEMLQHERHYSGEGGEDLEIKPRVNLDGWDFPEDDDMVFKGDGAIEGDCHKSASWMARSVASQMKENVKQVLKAKNSLEAMIDKIRSTVTEKDGKTNGTLKKMDAMLKDFENLYDEMTEAKAEGHTGGYGEKLPVCKLLAAECKAYFLKAQMSKSAALEAANRALGPQQIGDICGMPAKQLIARIPGMYFKGHCCMDLDQRLIPETSLASKILWHCVKTVNCIRQENGGNSLCVFKIGLTSNPLQRRQSYREHNFMSFVVIHRVCRLELLAMLEMLEAALIAEFYDNQRCCRNFQLGGESMRRSAVAAKDLVIDARSAVKRDPCAVLAKIAQVQLSSADTPLYALLRKHGLALPIDISWKKAGKEPRYPFFSPKAQLEVLSEQGYFYRVAGVPADLACEALDLFWQKFKAVHPQHDIFLNSENRDFRRLIPYYLHGDGGRGYKKDPIEILSMFPALGTGSRHREVDLSLKRRLQSEIELGINLQGNSGATRFLFSVVSSLDAKKDGQIFDDLIEIWSHELKELYDNGFQANGHTWHVIILGFTGDAPFVKKIAKTNRSFHNVRKRHNSKNVQKGCCWLCHAGFDSPDEDIFFPFEHLGFTQPAWLATCHLNNPLPWDGEGSVLLRHMKLDRADTPAAFWRADMFHVWHAGVGQDFTASGLIYCMKALFGLGSVAKDLNALNELLQQWMQRTKNRLHCGRSLTEDLLGYSSTREYPEANWSKNMDTAVVMKFIVYLLQRPDFQEKVQQDDIMKEILACALAIGRVMKVCFEAEFFMSNEHCMTVIDCGHSFLCGYSKLVNMCYSRQLCLFKLRPKVHYLNHIFLRVLEEWRSSGTATNPIGEATFMSEDFVGRTARLSRRVNTRAVAVKSLQRYALFMKTALDSETFSMLLDDLAWLD